MLREQIRQQVQGGIKARGQERQNPRERAVYHSHGLCHVGAIKVLELKGSGQGGHPSRRL